MRRRKDAKSSPASSPPPCSGMFSTSLRMRIWFSLLFILKPRDARRLQTALSLILVTSRRFPTNSLAASMADFSARSVSLKTSCMVRLLLGFSVLRASMGSPPLSSSSSSSLLVFERRFFNMADVVRALRIRRCSCGASGEVISFETCHAVGKHDGEADLPCVEASLLSPFLPSTFVQNTSRNSVTSSDEKPVSTMTSTSRRSCSSSISSLRICSTCMKTQKVMNSPSSSPTSRSDQPASMHFRHASFRHPNARVRLSMDVMGTPMFTSSQENESLRRQPQIPTAFLSKRSLMVSTSWFRKPACFCKLAARLRWQWSMQLTTSSKSSEPPKPCSRA
mmetsp:Transcript_32965/g.84159  ORF Transcript_32965/g.84159 Transcript_32965/m.84159 type:complete len:336 (+) Transcript_32965:212-1219(+)